MNHLHRFIDRPLFLDVSLREEDGKTMEAEDNPLSFRREMELHKSYGYDGGVCLVGEKMYNDRYIKNDRLMATYGIQGLSLSPAISTYEKDTPKFVEGMSNVIAQACISPYAQRVDGKLLLTSYVSDRLTPQQWKDILTELRKRHGDVFFFVPELRTGWWGCFRPLLEGKPVPKEVDEKFQAMVRQYLDVCDGVMYAGCNEAKGSDFRLDAACFRYIVHLFRDIASEPAYKGKFIGFGSSVGYVNHFVGTLCDEDGTKQLRRSFEIALEGRPDFITTPEWNEPHENTYLQPSVFNSFSSQRILSHYMRRLKNEPTAGNPGDDPSIPNLVVSYRSVLEWGEALEIELLNIPDSDKEEIYEARLSLLDPQGNTVKTFPPEIFSVPELRDKTFVVATEDLLRHRVLRPSLEVISSRGGKKTFMDGLLHICLVPTLNWNYKWVKQPLRDLCRPQTARLEIDPAKPAKPATPGYVLIRGAFECDEDLASVEILDRGDELWAYDRLHEYPDPATNAIIYVNFSKRIYDTLNGTLTVENAEFDMKPLLGAHHSIRHTEWKREGPVLRLASQASTWKRAFYLILPRKAAKGAVIHLDTNLIKVDVPVQTILDNGIYAKTECDLMFRFEKFDKLPDHPVHINRKGVEFTACLKPETPDAILHLRAITKSGKIYRSRPIDLGRLESGKTCELAVYSKSKKAVCTVNCDKAWIPDLVYAFNPRYGSLLPASVGTTDYAQYGMIGGAAEYGWPHGALMTGSYPEGLTQTAPTWIVEDGRPCLKFDGKGNYADFIRTFPLPARAFSLVFEIKPTTAKEQILFRHGGGSYESFSLHMAKDGALYVTYMNKYYEPGRLDPKLSLPVGQWSRIAILYDLKNLVFIVNGKKSEPIPFYAPGKIFAMFSFGGYGTDSAKYFEGCLRYLRVAHRKLSETEIGE